ncbi:MAG TPA: peptidoglycan DD-metalloendopeptidase family protein [Vicinamibacteria bacterium]|nr:peptidoglycan DD-metalloendopeptidase family protein [Vicinamibacteria bacterium]
MPRAIATLLAVVAIAGWAAPPGQAQTRNPAPQTSKQKPRAKRKTTTKPRPASTPGPSPVAALSPKPPENQTGPSESDAAKLARIRARREAVEREILKLRNQAESTLRDLDSIDLDLRLAAHRFDEAELEFKETTRLLDSTIREVQATRDKIEATRPRVLKSLAALSKLGELSYARLLFSLDDPADILRGYRYVSRIASADGDQIRGFKASLVQLGELEAQLKKRTAENLETRRRLNEARGLLSTRKAGKEARIEAIAREQQLQEELVEEYQKREAEMLRLLGETGEVSPAGESVQPAAEPIAPFQSATSLLQLRGGLPWPVRGTLVRKFGVERDPQFGTRTIQQGIEIDAFPEIEVHAVHAGRVVYADQFVGYGMLVIIDHGNREHTLYGRLGELKVAPGDDVSEGSLLGLLPNTRVTGSGLHFEVRVQGKPEDPLDWLKKP